ncbi:MAG: ABC transporter ATP-binding protein [Oscillospiraceae bacterium]|nr:ABC transporter ATP-binding protein [Oscillospiraceae bacterium]
MDKIAVEGLSVEYEDRNGAFLALEDVTFQVREGEFLSIVGPSGCGKSTLLGVLQGLRQPTSGRALLNGQPITTAGADRAAVFQHYSLFPWMTARGNITFAVSQAKRGSSRRERERIANRFLQEVGLKGFGNKYPFQLSGGMQQRVAIARALAMDADVLLMDEPFGAIDVKNRAAMQELLLSLWEGEPGSGRKTVVFVTHDIDEAIFLSDRILMIAGRPGRVVKEVTTPYPRPRVHEEIVGGSAYFQLRSQLVSLFLDDVRDRIGGEEVVL